MEDGLERELERLIIRTCKVQDAVEGLPLDAPFIGADSPFGLDSLDAVEIVAAVQKEYQVRFDQYGTSVQALRSLRALADFIRARRED